MTSVVPSPLTRSIDPDSKDLFYQKAIDQEKHLSMTNVAKDRRRRFPSMTFTFVPNMFSECDYHQTKLLLQTFLQNHSNPSTTDGSQETNEKNNNSNNQATLAVPGKPLNANLAKAPEFPLNFPLVPDRYYSSSLPFLQSLLALFSSDLEILSRIFSIIHIGAYEIVSKKGENFNSLIWLIEGKVLETIDLPVQINAEENHFDITNVAALANHKPQANTIVNNKSSNSNNSNHNSIINNREPLRLGSILESGELFGTMDYFYPSEYNRSMSRTALSPCTLAVLSYNDLNELSKSNNKDYSVIGDKLIRYMAIVNQVKQQKLFKEIQNLWNQPAQWRVHKLNKFKSAATSNNNKNILININNTNNILEEPIAEKASVADRLSRRALSKVDTPYDASGPSPSESIFRTIRISPSPQNVPSPSIRHSSLSTNEKNTTKLSTTTKTNNNNNEFSESPLYKRRFSLPTVITASTVQTTPSTPSSFAKGLDHQNINIDTPSTSKPKIPPLALDSLLGQKFGSILFLRDGIIYGKEYPSSMAYPNMPKSNNNNNSFLSNGLLAVCGNEVELYLASPNDADRNRRLFNYYSDSSSKSVSVAGLRHLSRDMIECILRRFITLTIKRERKKFKEINKKASLNKTTNNNSKTEDANYNACVAKARYELLRSMVDEEKQYLLPGKPDQNDTQAINAMMQKIIQLLTGKHEGKETKKKNNSVMNAPLAIDGEVDQSSSTKIREDIFLKNFGAAIYQLLRIEDVYPQQEKSAKCIIC